MDEMFTPSVTPSDCQYPPEAGTKWGTVAKWLLALIPPVVLSILFEVLKSDTVTEECIVTDLVTSLPTNDPVCWADAIRAAKTARTDHLEDIQRSGYDITAAAEKLTRFYLNGETL